MYISMLCKLIFGNKKYFEHDLVLEKNSLLLDPCWYCELGNVTAFVKSRDIWERLGLSVISTVHPVSDLRQQSFTFSVPHEKC